MDFFVPVAIFLLTTNRAPPPPLVPLRITSPEDGAHVSQFEKVEGTTPFADLKH